MPFQLYSAAPPYNYSPKLNNIFIFSKYPSIQNVNIRPRERNGDWLVEYKFQTGWRIHYVLVCDFGTKHHNLTKIYMNSVDHKPKAMEIIEMPLVSTDGCLRNQMFCLKFFGLWDWHSKSVFYRIYSIALRWAFLYMGSLLQLMYILSVDNFEVRQVKFNQFIAFISSGFVAHSNRICRRISLCRPNSVRWHWKRSCSRWILRAFRVSWNASQRHRFSRETTKRGSTFNALCTYIGKLFRFKACVNFRLLVNAINFSHRLSLFFLSTVLSAASLVIVLPVLEWRRRLPFLYWWIDLISFSIECEITIFCYPIAHSGIHSTLMRSYRTFSISQCCTYSTRFPVGQLPDWIYRLMLWSMDCSPSLNTNWKCSAIDCKTRMPISTNPFWFIGKFYSNVHACRSGLGTEERTWIRERNTRQ